MLLDYYPAPSLQQLWQRIKQQRWLRLWRQQLPVDYPLTVHLTTADVAAAANPVKNCLN